MGCDIHGYIEYEDWKDEEGKVHRGCFGGGRINRDYRMFALLAGVRGDGCIYKPRGIPKELSYKVFEEFHIYISNEYPEGEGNTSPELAAKWVKSGYSEYVSEKYVTNPDWHTPSWLSVEEYENVLEARKRMDNGWFINQKWYAILAAMKALKNARFVFWFDN